MPEKKVNWREVPTAWRILAQLPDRINDAHQGVITAEELSAYRRYAVCLEVLASRWKDRVDKKE